MIKLLELAEYNAAKKNKTRNIAKTHKDIKAFLKVQARFEYINYHVKR